MAKAEVVGEVAMLVVADTGKFAGDLSKKVKKAITKLSASSTFAPLTRLLGKAGETAGEAFSKGLGRGGRRRGRDGGRDVAEGFISGVVASVKGGASAVASAAGVVTEALGSAFKTGISAFSGGAQGLIGAFSSAAAAGPVGIAAVIVALVAGLVAFVAVAPVVVAGALAIGAALASLIGVVAAGPAVLGVFLAALLPLILAFQGFGDAVSALASGDLDKFNEALEKLSPSARKVARELKAAMPFFTQLRKEAQEAFFGPLVGDLARLAKVLGPTLSSGVRGVAGSFGGLVSALLEIAARPEVARTFDAIFKATSRIVGAFSKPVGNFFLALTRAAGAALPAVETFFNSIASGVGKFADFISRSVADGSFQSFLQRGFDTLGLIFSIIQKIGVVLADIFLDPGLQDAGTGFLEGVRTALDKLHVFFQSPQGKLFLQDLITLTEHLTATLGDLAPVLGWLLGLFVTLTRGAVTLLNLVDRILGKSKKLPDSQQLGATFAKVALQGFAAGGEVSKDGVYRLAEGGRREVVLPMTNPARARQVAAETGVTSMLFGNSSPNFDIKVYLGTREIEDVVGVEIKNNNQAQTRALASGPRTE